MRRAAVVVFLSASLAVLPSAFAQNAGHPGLVTSGPPAGAVVGGGHVAGATMGRLGGGFAGGSYVRPPGFVRPPAFAPHTFAPAPNFASSAPRSTYVPGKRLPFGGSASEWHSGDHRDHDRDHDHDRNRNFRYGSPYQGLGYGGYPYLFANSWELLPGDVDATDFGTYGDDSGSEAEQQQPTAAVAPPSDGYRPEYTGSPEPTAEYAPPPAVEEQPPASVAREPALTLIFSDGHREDIHNYVLTSDAVIVLDEAASGRQKRIPLSSLDLSATQQAAQQQGLDFTPPA